MREIKFRAWVIPSKEMYQVDSIDFEDEYFSVLQDNYECYRLDTFPIMQYTGLKDSNGVEIYEGDIVRLNDSRHLTGVVTYGVYKESKCIEYSCGHFGFYAKVDWSDCCLNNTGFDFSDSDGAQSIEVIGNIYENPELIGDSRNG